MKLRLPLVGVGLWIGLIVIPILLPLGLLAVTQAGCKVLYRTDLSVRPLWTALVFHALVMLFLLLAAAWFGYTLLTA